MANHPNRNQIRLIPHPDDPIGVFRLSERSARAVERKMGYMPAGLSPCTPQQGAQYWIIDLRA